MKLCLFHARGLITIGIVVGLACSVHLQVSASGIMGKPSGPHGAYDPHVKLSPEKQIQVALQHRQEGRMNEALAALEQALKQYPDHARLNLIRGSLRLESGNVALALVDLERAVKLDPKDPSAWVNRAQAYRRFGRNKAALKDLEEAIKVAPDMVAARFNRGTMLFDSGKNKLALKDFDHCIAVDPHNPGAYFNRAVVYQSMGKKANALSDMQRFIQLAKDEGWKKSANDIIKQWQAEKDR